MLLQLKKNMQKCVLKTFDLLIVIRNVFEITVPIAISFQNLAHT